MRIRFYSAISLMSFLFVFSFGAPNVLCGQDVIEEVKQMSLGSAAALTFEVEECNAEVTEQLWEERVKSFGGKPRKNKSANEWVLEDVSLVGIGGSKPVTIYAQFSGHGKTTIGSFWIVTQDGNVSAEKDSEEFERAQNLIQEFVWNAQRASLDEELLSEEKVLDNLKKDLEKIEKNHFKYVNMIRECETTTVDMESKIEQNKKDQEVVLDALSNIKSSDGGESAEKKMKKELNKLQKDNDKYHKEIDKCTKTIRDSHIDIENNTTAYDQQNELIRTQREIIRLILERKITIGKLAE